jgi:uncharacterized membrane protein YkvA (DUF1232 family)
MSEDRITIELNPRDARFYDRLRARIAAPSTGPGMRSGLRDFALLLPDLSVLLTRLLRDPRVPRGPKFVALLGLGYVLSPIDLLPEILLGPIGLVDDLLVVTAALSLLLNDVHPDVVRQHWSGKGDALDVIQRASQWSRSFVRRKFGAALRRVLRIGS